MPPQNAVDVLNTHDVDVDAIDQWMEEAAPTRLLSIAIAKRRELYQARERDYRREILHSGMIKALCGVIGEGRAANRRSRNNRRRSRRRKRRHQDDGAWAASIVECDWEEECGSDDDEMCVRSRVAGGRSVGGDPPPSPPFTHPHHIQHSRSAAGDRRPNGGIQATGATATCAMVADNAALPMPHDQLVPRESREAECEERREYTTAGEPARKRFKAPTPPTPDCCDDEEDPFGLMELFTFSPIRADHCPCREDAGTGSAKAH